MDEVTLKIIETSAPPNGVWTSELWSGAPGSAGAARIAGGQPYTQAQLEAPTPQGTVLDQATVLDKIRNEEQSVPVFADIGLRLHELLDVTGTATDWKLLRTKAQAQGPSGGLRTYLQVDGALADWPWELLAWPVPGVAGNQTRAFESTRHPMVRTAALGAPEPAWKGTTVRILLVSGQEKLEDKEFASVELRLIRQAFHKVGLSVLVDLCEAPESKDLLEERLRSFCPHIVHFIGHGTLDAAQQTDFVLRFNKPTPAKTFDWEWSANEIGQFFSESVWKPRLVVLNSCHSSQRELHAAPVAAALLAAGVPAVIGAQAALQIDFAREFSRAFYAALAKEQPVDQAVAAARTWLSGQARYQGFRRRHWALPVLTVQAPPLEIVRFTRTYHEIADCEVARDVFTRPGRFVNRTSDRWSILSALCPADGTKPSFRGVILESDTAKVGKGWLVKRCLRDFVDAGFMVRYATLVSPELGGKTSLDVLEEWRGLDKFKSPLLRPIDAPHFDAFDQALTVARADPSAPNKEEVFRTFKKGLQSARQGRNVLLVLERFRKKDGSGVQSQDFQNQLLEKLLLPIRMVDPPDPEVDGVYVLLIVRTHNDVAAGGQSEDLEEFSLVRLSYSVPDERARVPADGFRRLKVSMFKGEQFDNHFDEFADFQTSKSLVSLREAFRDDVSGNLWSPTMLDDYERPIVRALSKAAAGQ
jgi:hypothetical protein